MSATDPTKRISDRITDLEGEDTGNDTAISALQAAVALKLPSNATSLGAAAALGDTDVVTVVQGGVAVKTTLSALKTYFTA